MNAPDPATSRALIGWLWRGYLRRQAGWIALAFVLMATEGASLGLFAASVQPMFDRIFVAAEPGAIWVVGLAIVGIFLLRAVTSLSQKILMARISETSAAALRGDLLGHLMQLDGAWHQAHPPGYLIERVQGDTSAIARVWAALALALGRDGIAVVSLFSVALWVDWRWTLVACAGVPLLLLPSLLVQAYVRARAGRARELAARMSLRLDEVFHGLTAIRLNGIEALQARRFNDLSARKVVAETRGAAGQALIPALLDVMTGFGFLAVLFYGGAEIASGDKTVGQFMAFFTAMSMAFEPLRRLGGLSAQWQAAAASIERLRAILSEPLRITSPVPARAAPPASAFAAGQSATPAIEFRDVHLAYGDVPALRGVTLTAAAGETTAVVGASGAGKSTLFQTLARLVDPDRGEILIGGVPVTRMALPDLRSLFGVVTQDSALFDDSLRDNIVMGQDVPEAALAEAIRAAHLEEVIAALPQGLDSPAGPRGSALSGGQRQRVAIARALLRNRPILLLDEATSALDARSETLVQQALDRLASGRTTLVIAHRLATVRRAHRIVVMDRGRVAETGTHDSLLAADGVYAGLYRLQFGRGD